LSHSLPESPAVDTIQVWARGRVAWAGMAACSRAVPRSAVKLHASSMHTRSMVSPWRASGWGLKMDTLEVPMLMHSSPALER
jgi:hypothetical protein